MCCARCVAPVCHGPCLSGSQTKEQPQTRRHGDRGTHCKQKEERDVYDKCGIRGKSFFLFAFLFSEKMWRVDNNTSPSLSISSYIGLSSIVFWRMAPLSPCLRVCGYYASQRANLLKSLNESLKVADDSVLSYLFVFPLTSLLGLVHGLSYGVSLCRFL
jgi:hypothetical protein